MTNKSFWDNSSLQEEIKWDNQELPGCPDKVLLTKNWNIVDSNIRTWKDPKVAKKRKEAIRRVKQEQAEFSKEELLKIYNNSWGPNRRSGWIDQTVKKYEKRGLLKNRLNHLINNGFQTVSPEVHNTNLEEWEIKYGFGVWEVFTPGVDLLKDYDRAYSENIIPPSAVWFIRFKMKDSNPKEIRDYLLKYTDGKYWMDKDRIANGRYLNVRNKIYPFLTDQKSEKITFKDAELLKEWLKNKMNRKSLSRMYMHQVLNKGEIKQVGPLAGYKIKKKN